MHLELETCVIVAVAVLCALVFQLACVQISLADHIVHLNRIDIECQRALVWQAGDFDSRQVVPLRAVIAKISSIQGQCGVFCRIERVVCALRAAARQDQAGNVGQVQHAIGILCNHIKPQNTLTQTQSGNVLNAEAAIGLHLGRGRDFVILLVPNHQRQHGAWIECRGHPFHIDHCVRVQHILGQGHGRLQLIARQLNLACLFNAFSRGNDVHLAFAKHARPNVGQAEFSALYYG